MADRPVPAVTAQHKALTEFRGRWHIKQRVFASADSKPEVNEGKARARVLLDGRISFMNTRLENGYESVVMTTWNELKGEYEGVFMDSFCFGGFSKMNGLPSSGFPSAPGAEYDVGDEALNTRPSRERVWAARLTVPRFTVIAEGTPGILTGLDEVGVNIVEHRVSDDQWLLLCVPAAAVTGAQQFVQMENTFTRI